MAAISSITNGEAMSSVRTKLNTVITEINLLDPTGWIDYSATSTIVGWSSFTSKVLKYRIVGKQVFFIFQIDGISNSTTTTFTLPISAITYVANLINSTDNGSSAIGVAVVNASNTASFSKFIAINSGGTFTASGTKNIRGQFFIEIA